MKIIVGLGNPGKEYEATRHNIGFRVLNYINKEYPEAEPSARYGAGGGFRFDKKTNSEISEVKIKGKKVLLAKPQTFVNKSGEAVRKLAAGNKAKPKDIIIIHDDLDIPFGKTKISFGKSSAGHKGVESVIKTLKTEKFYRLRIGTFNSQIVKIKRIKDKRKKINGINNFVIGPFSAGEKPKLNKLIKDAVQKIISIL